MINLLSSQNRKTEGGVTLGVVMVAVEILPMGIGAAVSMCTGGAPAHGRAVDRLKRMGVSGSVFAAVEGELREVASMGDIRNGDLLTNLLQKWPGVSVDLSFATIPKNDFVDEVSIRMRIRQVSRGQQVEETFEQILARSRSVRLIPE